MKKRQKRIPSKETITRVFRTISFEELSSIFYNWASSRISLKKKDVLSLDGKSIRGTLTNANDSLQNFISLVSVYSQKKQQILCLEKIENKKESEIPVVQKLIKMLDLEGVTFTLDSLHCQKETVKTIIETGNNYIIQVKKNQPNLYKTLKKNCEPMKLKSKTIEKEKQKGREETREISVYSNIENIDKTWIGIKSIIKIKRKRKSKIKNQEGEYYYISSLNARTKASTFGKIIRGHWGIERYHYLKDVVLREDYSKIRKLNSPSNMSILRNIALNVFHSQKISKITEQMRLLRNNTKKMFDMILA